jgi:hypothetical protein
MLSRQSVASVISQGLAAGAAPRKAGKDIGVIVYRGQRRIQAVFNHEGTKARRK